MAPKGGVDVTIVATGGTIDKDYPRSSGGYAFEIDEPAAGRVLAELPVSGIAFDVISVCRKDSTVRIPTRHERGARASDTTRRRRCDRYSHRRSSKPIVTPSAQRCAPQSPAA